MRSGDLNKRIVIQQRTVGSPARDDFGQPNTVWEDFLTIWAAVEPLTGRELWAQQQIQNEITTRFRIRYAADIVSDMRISYANKYYVIKSIIDPMEEHVELQLMTGEGLRDG